MTQILLPAEFTENDRQIVLAYLREGHRFNRQDWQRAVIAFDLLKNAMVNSTFGLLPFPVIYRQHIEDHYADAFIERLYQAQQVAQTSVKLWAEAAGKIPLELEQAGLYDERQPTTRYLLAYCLYWWYSFTVGYALEIEIQQDLLRNGISFAAHDLRQRNERLSPYDLLISEFKGDIKTSTYFLQAVRSRDLRHDFYITQLRSRKGVRTLVVFIQSQMWQTIDGDTLLVKLEQIADTLEDAVHIQHQGLQVTVIDYALWKTKIIHHQAAIKKGRQK